MFVQIIVESFGDEQNKQKSQSNGGKLFSMWTSAQTFHVTGIEWPPQQTGGRSLETTIN